MKCLILLARICMGLWLGLLSATLMAQEKVITWATNPNYPPYDWSVNNTDYAGACMDLLRSIAPKGYVFRAVVVPWARAQEMAKRGELDMLVNIRVTPERQKWLEFSTNATFPNPIVVFMRKDKAIPLKSWDELKALQGGATLGDAFGTEFDEYLAKNLKVEVISNMSGNFAKLNLGRIDYFVSGYYMGLAFLSRLDYGGSIVALNPPVSNTPIHIAFSKLSPHREVLPEIDRSLAKLSADGTLNKLLKTYLQMYSETALPLLPQ